MACNCPSLLQIGDSWQLYYTVFSQFLCHGIASAVLWSFDCHDA